MAYKFILLVTICIAAFCSTTQAQECAACMDANEAYCVDETSFYFCNNKVPNKATLQKCPDKQFCTNSDNICESTDKITGAIVKPCSSNCNTCPASTATYKRYTCVSTTQFARCSGTPANPTEFISSCPTGELCSMDNYAKTGNICAPKCVLDFFRYESTCGNDLITTTSTTTTTLPPPPASDLQAKCKDANREDAIFSLPNNDCKTFIYCEKFGTSYEAILLTCPEYFDKTVGKCVDVKPAGCT